MKSTEIQENETQDVNGGKEGCCHSKEGCENGCENGCDGCEEEGGCSGCSGCGGRIPIEGENVGKTVKVHYKGTLEDGSQFDSSYDRGEPLTFVCGAGSMIRGFDEAVATMALSEKRTVVIPPEKAYGEADPRAVFTVGIAQLPGSEGLSVGDHVMLSNMMGQPFPVRVVAKNEMTITFDANHELAGKTLTFAIELVEIS